MAKKFDQMKKSNQVQLIPPLILTSLDNNVLDKNFDKTPRISKEKAQAKAQSWTEEQNNSRYNLKAKAIRDGAHKESLRSWKEAKSRSSSHSRRRVA